MKTEEPGPSVLVKKVAQTEVPVTPGDLRSSVVRTVVSSGVYALKSNSNGNRDTCIYACLTNLYGCLS